MSEFGTFRTCWGELTMSAPEGRADGLFGLIGFMSTHLEQDDFSSNRHPALSFYLSMISAQTRSALVS
jgi:hypothetical protein